MPSKKPKAATRDRHLVFLPLLLLLLAMWVLYRALFHFPVWFDETIGKAIFFGLPVGLYTYFTRSKSIRDTYGIPGMMSGLLLGVAVGGIFGFAGSLASLVSKGAVVQAAPLFLSNAFWWQFFLAMMTGFWESLFFYCWVMVVIGEKFPKWSLANQLLLVVIIYIAFHIPNTLLRFAGMQAVVTQLALLTVFALGQGLFFAKTKNLYALTLSYAIWGMVLLVNTR